MESHNALELLVLPVIRGVGGVIAVFALIRVIQIGLGMILGARPAIQARAAFPEAPAGRVVSLRR